MREIGWLTGSFFERNLDFHRCWRAAAAAHGRLLYGFVGTDDFMQEEYIGKLRYFK